MSYKAICRQKVNLVAIYNIALNGFIPWSIFICVHNIVFVIHA